MISSPGFSAFGPLLSPSLAMACTLPPRTFHSTIEPSFCFTSNFIDEWGLTSLNALNAPATLASLPSAYIPAREWCACNDAPMRRHPHRTMLTWVHFFICDSSLMTNLCRCTPGLEFGLAVAAFTDRPPGIRRRVAPEDSCRHHQRLHQHFRILERQVVEDGVAFTPELLHDVHLLGVEVPAAPDPGRVDEADGVEHERIAVPLSHRVAEVLRRELRVLAVLAAVGGNNAELRHSSARIRKLSVEERDVVARLENAPRRPLAGETQRLARHHRIFLVGPHVELLDLVPVLRFVEQTALHAETGR